MSKNLAKERRGGLIIVKKLSWEQAQPLQAEQLLVFYRVSGMHGVQGWAEA